MPEVKIKTCLICEETYSTTQFATQKYCGRKCKEKARYIQAIKKQLPKKGGYSRSTYIRVWMKSRQNAGFNDKNPFTANCTYCGRSLSIDDKFCLDHIIPRSKLKDLAVKEESNLCISCPECNQAKGSMTLEEFTGENGRKTE
jgi:5-methylcytosine-specific restriction endonuclease McrA